jgi:DNA (cytosine-5)-methyltransferase 1
MQTNDRLKLLDLFSGIGGFSLGLEASGYFKTVAFCEIEDFPRRVLSEKFSGVPIYDDVRTLTAERLRTDGIVVDAICGGFPCQDISVSGAGEGLDGDRSGLWFEYARLIGELRPRLVFMENVSALLGRGLGRVLGSLAALGYDAEWHCIPASYVGAPHERDRLWIAAYPSRLRRQRSRGLVDALHSTSIPFRQADELVASVQRDAVPFVCRRHDGVPRRLAQPRLRSLGNAVVPQIPEILGRVFGPPTFNTIEHHCL